MSNVSAHELLSERLSEAIASLDSVPIARVTGRLVKVNGLMLQAVGCRFKLEQRCLVETAEGDMIEAQVVGFDHNVAYLMPIRRLGGLFAVWAACSPVPKWCRSMATARCKSVISGSGAW